MLLSRKNGTRSFILVTKVLLLFRLSCLAYEKKQVLFLQCMQWSLLFDRIDQRLNCVCLARSTKDEVGYTLKQLNARVASHLSVGECCGFESLYAVKWDMPILSAKLLLHPFTLPPGWMYHRFYINRFQKSHGVI